MEQAIKTTELSCGTLIEFKPDSMLAALVVEEFARSCREFIQSPTKELAQAVYLWATRLESIKVLDPINPKDLE